MNLFECIKMAFSALFSNKARSLLTMLGVIIGVAAVIALLSLGQAAQNQISSQITQLGTNQITVSLRGSAQFTDGDAEALLSRVPGLAYASPVLSQQVSAKAGTKTHDTRIEGVSSDYDKIRAYSLDVGRWFDEDEVIGRRKVAVLGPTAYEKLFQKPPSTGDSMSIRGQTYVIIGVTEKKGSSFGSDPDDLIWIPYTSAERLFGTRRISTIMFKSHSAEVASQSAGHLNRILEERFRSASRRADGSSAMTQPFSVMSQDELLDTVSQMTATFTVLLAGIASVSLLVGGIGIMNIMLVSVTERTREIGLRKAIGAKRKDVLLQFIVESVAVSATGGSIGIVFGSWLAKFLGAFGELPVDTSAASVLLSFGFASAVGVFFGVYPALKASNLDPIEALRYE